MKLIQRFGWAFYLGGFVGHYYKLIPEPDKLIFLIAIIPVFFLEEWSRKIN